MPARWRPPVVRVALGLIAVHALTTIAPAQTLVRRWAGESAITRIVTTADGAVWAERADVDEDSAWLRVGPPSAAEPDGPTTHHGETAAPPTRLVRSRRALTMWNGSRITAGTVARDLELDEASIAALAATPDARRIVIATREAASNRVLTAALDARRTRCAGPVETAYEPREDEPFVPVALAVALDGTLWVAVAGSTAGLVAITDGRVTRRVAMAEAPIDLGFGRGPSATTLFAATARGVWSLGTSSPGFHVDRGFVRAEPSPPGVPDDQVTRWRNLLAEIRDRFPRVEQLDVRTLARRRAADTLDVDLVDVRAPAEFAVSRLAGARSVPLHDDDGSVRPFLDAFADVPKDRPILVYCSVGYRSSDAAERLRRAGFAAVANLEGSLFAWANAGYPLVDAAGPTDRVHPFDASWGRLLRPERRAEIDR